MDWDVIWSSGLKVYEQDVVLQKSKINFSKEQLMLHGLFKKIPFYS